MYIICEYSLDYTLVLQLRIVKKCITPFFLEYREKYVNCQVHKYFAKYFADLLFQVAHIFSV